MNGQERKDPPYQLRPRKRQEPSDPEPRPREWGTWKKHDVDDSGRGCGRLTLHYWHKLATPRVTRNRIDIDAKGMTGGVRIIHGGADQLHLFYLGDPTRIATEDRGQYPFLYEFAPKTRAICDAGFTCGVVSQAPNHQELGLLTFGEQSLRLFVMLKDGRDQPALAEGVPSTSRATGPAPLIPVDLASSDGSDEEAPEEEEMVPSPIVPESVAPEEMEVIPELNDERVLKRERIQRLFRMDQREGDLNDAILVDETPETSKDENVVTRHEIIPETPEVSIDETQPEGHEDLSPSEETAKEASRERVNEEKEDSFFEHAENRILHVFMPQRLLPPKSPERQQVTPVPTTKFYPKSKPTGPRGKGAIPKDTRRPNENTGRVPVALIIANSLQGAAEQSSLLNSSTTSLNSSTSGKRVQEILYLSFIIEELERAEHHGFADELREFVQSAHDYSVNGFRRRLQESHQEVYGYLKMIELNGLAWRLANDREIFEVPVSANWLPTAITDRIFSKIIDECKKESTSTVSQKKILLHTFKRAFRAIYPNGDWQYYLSHGKPSADSN